MKEKIGCREWPQANDSAWQGTGKYVPHAVCATKTKRWIYVSAVAARLQADGKKQYLFQILQRNAFARSELGLYFAKPLVCCVLPLGCFVQFSVMMTFAHNKKRYFCHKSG